MPELAKDQISFKYNDDYMEVLKQTSSDIWINLNSYSFRKSVSKHIVN